jgi:hypothetical protein
MGSMHGHIMNVIATTKAAPIRIIVTIATRCLTDWH